MLENLWLGTVVAFSLQNLLYCFIGVLVGTIVGVLPGIGTIAAISMLLPVTFHMEPTSALVMLAGIYYGGQYGGSTASILLNLPGSPSSAVATLDGYPMAQQGRAGLALFLSIFGSFIGGCIGIIVLSSSAPFLARVGQAFGPAEYFSMMVLGLIGAAALAQGSPVKGMAMVVLGLLLGTIGIDVNSGVQRFTMGVFEFAEGISLVVLAMGLFGVAEIIASVKNAGTREQPKKVSLRELVPKWSEVKESLPPILRGTGIGTLFGILPGTGTTVSTFMSYSLEKRISKDPSKFGKGAIEGISAPEAANNAAAQTGFVPTLTLGVPGDVVMALMLGAMIIHGITPGPMLITQHPDLFWGLIMSFWIGNVILVILNLPLIGLWVGLLRIPYQLLYPAVIVLVCMGVYTVNSSPLEIMLVAGFGAGGYLLRRLGFEVAPLLVAFVLGPLMEQHLRRALQISRGDLGVLIERPISATLLAFAVLLLVWGFVSARRKRKARVVEEMEADA